jgi:methyl-accepting chemotaxis protein
MKAQINDAGTLAAEYAKSVIALTSQPGIDQAEQMRGAFEAKYSALDTGLNAVSEKLESWEHAIAEREASYENLKLASTACAVIALLMVLVVQYYVQMVIMRKNNQMTDAMQKIADGETDTEIPHTNRTDELGEMARTVQVFKDNAMRVQNLAKEREEQERAAQAEKRRAMDSLANHFEANVKNVAFPESQKAASRNFPC